MREHQMPEKPYAKEFMTGVRERDRCDWCGRDERMKRKGLCRHCNKVQKDLDRIEKLAVSEPGDFVLNWELRVARQKKKDCVVWGQMLRGILDGPVDALGLEGWFRMLARKIARDDVMHRGTATMLGWTFTPEQRQVLAYMFWEVFGAEASHNRWGRAMSKASRESRK